MTLVETAIERKEVIAPTEWEKARPNLVVSLLSKIIHPFSSVRETYPVTESSQATSQIICVIQIKLTKVFCLCNVTHRIAHFAESKSRGRQCCRPLEGMGCMET